MAPDCQAANPYFSPIMSNLEDSFSACSLATSNEVVSPRITLPHITSPHITLPHITSSHEVISPHEVVSPPLSSSSSSSRIHLSFDETATSSSSSSSPPFTPLQPTEFGASGTLQHRILFLDSFGNPGSPYHDVPLNAGPGLLNFVCLTPHGGWIEYEPAENEPFTPLRIRNRRGRPSHFTEDCQSWNFGFLPQTCANRESCKEVKDSWGGMTSQGWSGPVEVVEVGVRTAKTGEVYPVKPLGAFCVFDGEGRHSWKLLAISVQEDDKDIQCLSLLEDLFSGLSNTLHEVREWLKTCHVDVEAGDPENCLRNGTQPVGAQAAIHVVEEAHSIWRQCTVTRDLKASWSSEFESARTASDFEKLWEKYTADASRVRISLSGSHLTSLMHLVRAWADSSEEDVVDVSGKLSGTGDRKVEKEGSGKESSKFAGHKAGIKMAQLWKSVVNAIRPSHTDTAQSPSSSTRSGVRARSISRPITRRKSLPVTGFDMKGPTEDFVDRGERFFSAGHARGGSVSATFSLSLSRASTSPQRNNSLPSDVGSLSPGHDWHGVSSFSQGPRSGPLQASYESSERDISFNGVRKAARLRRASSLTATFLEATLRQGSSSPLTAVKTSTHEHTRICSLSSAGDLAEPEGLRSFVRSTPEGWQDQVSEIRKQRAFRVRSQQSPAIQRTLLNGSVDVREGNYSSNSRNLQAALCEGACPPPVTGSLYLGNSGPLDAQMYFGRFSEPLPTIDASDETCQPQSNFKRSSPTSRLSPKLSGPLSAKVTLTKGLAERLREQSQAKDGALKVQ